MLLLRGVLWLLGSWLNARGSRDVLCETRCPPVHASHTWFTFLPAMANSLERSRGQLRLTTACCSAGWLLAPRAKPLCHACFHELGSPRVAHKPLLAACARDQPQCHVCLCHSLLFDRLLQAASKPVATVNCNRMLTTARPTSTHGYDLLTSLAVSSSTTLAVRLPAWF